MVSTTTVTQSWSDTLALESLAMDIGDAKFLCFFSTRWNAETFKQGQAMPPGRGRC